MKLFIFLTVCILYPYFYLKKSLDQIHTLFSSFVVVPTLLTFTRSNIQRTAIDLFHLTSIFLILITHTIVWNFLIKTIFDLWLSLLRNTLLHCFWQGCFGKDLAEVKTYINIENIKYMIRNYFTWSFWFIYFVFCFFISLSFILFISSSWCCYIVVMINMYVHSLLNKFNIYLILKCFLITVNFHVIFFL